MVSFWDLAYILGAPWDTGQPPGELTELIEEGRLEPCRVLDIGGGTGTSVVYLAIRGFEASGLDISRLAKDDSV
jgi:2-polyprenyl-3-methyl-5-hydroxy-6-metoxy-1,4-benzoquinol methylase